MSSNFDLVGHYKAHYHLAVLLWRSSLSCSLSSLNLKEHGREGWRWFTSSCVFFFPLKSTGCGPLKWGVFSDSSPKWEKWKRIRHSRVACEKRLDAEARRFRSRSARRSSFLSLSQSLGPTPGGGACWHNGMLKILIHKWSTLHCAHLWHMC